MNAKFHHAGQAATACLQEAVASIDGQFGEGYADKHPELTAAVVTATSHNLSVQLFTHNLKELLAEHRQANMSAGCC